MLTKTLTELFLAALVFTGGHFVLSAEPVRTRLVAMLGEPRFLAGYSVLMLAVFAWLILSYARAPYVGLWANPGWARALALALMPIAFVLLTGAFRPDNPTSVGALARASEDRPDSSPSPAIRSCGRARSGRWFTFRRTATPPR